ncbi:NADPH-dependent oxidoreductase [Legionella israelensis]|uniref:nitroreductase family protein n=1 Tax=Legionella israelensis TaxID=454 RepID=UPI00117EABAC|nr:nitroreductase family protein [Legionella israelensis]QDP72380.1 NADPH-dependent oxidoreductase [Legionella israelensis]
MPNPLFDQMKQRSSVRSFIPNKEISDNIQKQLIEAAQMSSSSFNLQTYSIINIEDKKKRHQIARLSGEQWFINDASLFWIFCVDLYKMVYVTEQASYKYFQSDFFESTLMGVIDTSLVAQGVATLAESLGLGICMIGGVRNNIEELIKILELPQKVIPIVGLCIGYPNKKNPPKPRVYSEGVFFKDKYDMNLVKEAINKYSYNMFSSGYYVNREFPIDEVEVLEYKKEEYGWIHHSARRVSTKNINKARTKLKQIFINNNFGFE